MTHPASQRSAGQRGRQSGTVLARRGGPYRGVGGFYGRLCHEWQTVFGEPQLLSGRVTAAWPTLADIEETDDAFVVEIDLPGVRADDIRLELRNNELRIHGEHREKDRVGVLRRQTRRIGEFEHVVSLPGEVDPNRVDATLHDGVLTVHLGKTAAARPRRIEIKSS